MIWCWFGTLYRFDNVEEPQNIFCKKRQTQAMCRNEKPKKMKFGGLDAFAVFNFLP